jgi:membrane-bound lytic murein transglycosylase
LLIDSGGSQKNVDAAAAPHRRKSAEQDEVFAYNESYVFFRLIDGGPQGSLGVPVTAGVLSLLMRGCFRAWRPALVQTDIPIIGAQGNWRDGAGEAAQSDTGGAIRGRSALIIISAPRRGCAGGYMSARAPVLWC